MIKIKDLIPLNQQEEKAKFFADQNYNPQFKYEKKIQPQDLTYYGLPKQEYMDLAQEIIDRAYDQKNETDIRNLEGPKIDQETIHRRITSFLKDHQLEKRFQITWSPNYISSVSISPELIKLKEPADFREGELTGMIYHEIGTHALRRFNYEQQIWFKKKNKYHLKNHYRTEEGLATFHSLLGYHYQYAIRWALAYIATSLSQHGSFIELWHYLKKYIQNPERLWSFTIRRKRGITDTSQAGGFTKDVVYLEGAVKVYQWLITNNFDLTKLYFGKISCDDTEKVYQLTPNFQPKLPNFFLNDRDKYQQNIQKIAEINQFENFLRNNKC